jgi:fimbrial chaperone protein
MRRVAALAAAVLGLLAATDAAGRGQLQAGPTLVEIVPGRTSARLRLTNNGDASLAAQVRVYAWTQEDGEDRLVATDALVASPPIAEIAPGAEQLVRIVLAGPAAPAGRDEAYRIVVDELPGPPESAQVVNVRMRFVVPLFVRATAAPSPLLACRLTEAGHRLACRNSGGQAAQLGASVLRAGDMRVALSDGLYGYVLPASERAWSLPAGSPPLAGTVTLESRINGEPATLSVERQP